MTLASGEVPLMLNLRLFLPESWTRDTARMDKAGVPLPLQEYRTKPEIAIEEIDRIIVVGVRLNGSALPVASTCRAKKPGW